MSTRVRKTLTEPVLSRYVAGQLNKLFDDGRKVDVSEVQRYLPVAMQRLEHCFNHINNKYFFDGSSTLFNHLHADQYAMFLYLLANTAFKNHAENDLPSKLFLLNKTLHGIDAFYEIELPSIFLFVHPLGTVLGRGAYSDHLLVYQRCSVGSNHDTYPTLGEFTTLRPGATVLGGCQLGRNCTLAAESLLIDRDLPDNTIYFGNPRDFATRAADDQPSIWRI